jgi:hypothetical protein
LRRGGTSTACPCDERFIYSSFRSRIILIVSISNAPKLARVGLFKFNFNTPPPSVSYAAWPRLHARCSDQPFLLLSVRGDSASEVHILFGPLQPTPAKLDFTSTRQLYTARGRHINKQS